MVRYRIQAVAERVGLMPQHKVCEDRTWGPIYRRGRAIDGCWLGCVRIRSKAPRCRISAGVLTTRSRPIHSVFKTCALAKDWHRAITCLYHRRGGCTQRLASTHDMFRSAECPGKPSNCNHHTRRPGTVCPCSGCALAWRHSQVLRRQRFRQALIDLKDLRRVSPERRLQRPPLSTAAP